MYDLNSQYMQLAIQEAWKYQFLTYPNPAVGATVVRDGQILAVSAHREAGKPHAEVLSLQLAYLTKYSDSPLKYCTSSQSIHDFLTLHHNNFFEDCEIYVTLEPCNHLGKTPACSVLLETINIKKVFIGTLDPNKNASGGKERLLAANIEVETDFCKEETDKLLYPFLQYQKGHFTFFKLAMRKDGSISGGYITTQESLNLVHEIRTKIDLMVIGGNTVRTDKPTLDARFSKSKKAPDILIYSKKVIFDKSIHLFSVANRIVNISSNLLLLKKKSFVMVEGGYSLFENIKQEIDYIMIFVSHKQKIKMDNRFINMGFVIEYSYYINEFDEVLFLKRVNAK